MISSQIVLNCVFFFFWKEWKVKDKHLYIFDSLNSHMNRNDISSPQPLKGVSAELINDVYRIISALDIINQNNQNMNKYRISNLLL